MTGRQHLKNHFCRALLTWFLLASVGVAYPHGFEALVQQLDDDDVAALVDDRVVTVGELKLLLSLRTAPYRKGDFLSFGVYDLIQTAREDSIYQDLAVQAVELGLQLAPEEEEQIARMTRDFARREIFKENILRKLKRPSIEELQKVYDAHRDDKFRTTEKLVYRIATVPHESTAGNEAPPSLRSAIKRLEAGASFSQVVDSIEGNVEPNTVRLHTTGESLELPPEVVESFHSLSNRRYSQPFKSTEGWHLLYRQLHVPASHIPFESLISLLVEMHESAQKRELVPAFFRLHPLSAELLLVRSENLLSRGDLALDDDILATVGGHSFTRRILMDAMGWALAKDARISPEEFREIALQSGPIQRALLDEIVDREGWLQRERILFYARKARETLLARKVIMQEINLESLEPDDEAINHHHRLELVNWTAVNESVVYDAIWIPRASPVLDEFALGLNQVHDRETFQKLGQTAMEGDGEIHRVDGLHTTVSKAPMAIIEVLARSYPESRIAASSDGRMASFYWIESTSIPWMPTAERREYIRNLLHGNALQDRVEEWLENQATVSNVVPYLPLQ